jgi:hypothetical protein
MTEETEVGTEVWLIQKFYGVYTSGKLCKPRIQRAKAWDCKMSKEYIEFIIKHKNTCQPLYISDEGCYILFDGNNRVNAILDFMANPLVMFPEIIPADLLPTYGDIFKKLSLIELTDGFRLDDEFFTAHAMPCKTGDSVINKMVKEMTSTLKAFNFMGIVVQINLFKDLTADSMRHIYESINKKGYPLTEQDLLASRLAKKDFVYTDLADQRQLMQKAATIYKKRNDVERLGMSTDLSEINLFEVLLVLQTEFNDVKSMFQGGVGMSVTFQVYMYLYGTGSDRSMEFPMTRQPPEELDAFIAGVRRAIGLMVDVLGEVYHMCPKYRHMSKTQTILYTLFIVKNPTMSSSDINGSIKRGLVYHEYVKQCDTLTATMIVNDAFYHSKSGFQDRGNYLAVVKHGRLNVPTDADIMQVMKLVHAQHVVSPKRKPVSSIKTILLSAFFYNVVPSGKKKDPHQIDHIFPFSCRGDEQIDICRLGNIQLIPTKVNKSRGNKPITDAWIQKNGLMYQHYPTEEEYAKVYNGKVIDVDQFNAMCSKRESCYECWLIQSLN